MQAPDGRRRTLGFEFLKPARSGRDVLVVEDLALRAGDKQLLDGAAFAIERGEHVALVGPNGSGKTTLLETVLGRREPTGGKIRLGHGVEAAYFSQHEAELDERGSVLDAAMSGTGLKRPEAQSLLGRFLFSGWDEHEKPVVALSGGERRRLALAIVVASGANFLVLDEPTNHLDLESRESLEAALEAFPGTVLLVSHDRALLDAVADRLLAVEERPIGRTRAAGPTTCARRRRRRRRSSAAEGESRAAEAAGEAEADRARARRGGGGAGRGAGRRARAEARRRLVRRGAGRRAQRRAQRSRRAAQALGIAVRSERIDASVIGSGTRIASSAPACASASSSDGKLVGRAVAPPAARGARRRRRRPRRAGTRSAARRRVAPGPLAGLVDPCVQLREAVGRLPNRANHVFHQSTCGNVAASMRGPSPPTISFGVRAGGGRSTASSTVLNARRTSRARPRAAGGRSRTPPRTARPVVEREPERAELGLVPAGTQAEPSRPPLTSSMAAAMRASSAGARNAVQATSGPSSMRESPRRAPRASSSSPTARARSGRRPVEQVVADPERVEARLLRRARHRRELGPATSRSTSGSWTPTLTPRTPRTPAGRSGSRRSRARRRSRGRSAAPGRCRARARAASRARGRRRRRARRRRAPTGARSGTCRR